MTNTQRALEAFKKLIPYLRGAIWWGRNDLIKKRDKSFNPNDDHIAHPLLSLNRHELSMENQGPFPMLLGTSAKKTRRSKLKEYIQVKGISEGDERITYFGSIVVPGLYTLDDLMDGVKAKNSTSVDEKTEEFKKEAWHKVRTMIPNWHKPMVDETEMSFIEQFETRHNMV